MRYYIGTNGYALRAFKCIDKLLVNRHNYFKDLALKYGANGYVNTSTLWTIQGIYMNNLINDNSHIKLKSILKNGQFLYEFNNKKNINDFNQLDDIINSALNISKSNNIKGRNNLTIYKGENKYLFKIKDDNICVECSFIREISEDDFKKHAKGMEIVGFTNDIFVKCKSKPHIIPEICPLWYNEEEREFYLGDTVTDVNFEIICPSIDSIDAETFFERMEKKYQKGRKSGRLPSLEIVIMEFNLFYTLKSVRNRYVKR